jgi:hypothetical protein
VLDRRLAHVGGEDLRPELSGWRCRNSTSSIQRIGFLAGRASADPDANRQLGIAAVDELPETLPPTSAANGSGSRKNVT